MAESVVRLSPRQKMINLMYIVLTAMLALNVSSDVLDGFVQVEDGLARTNASVGRRNDAIYRQLESFTEQNPGKGTPWLEKASDVRGRARALYEYVDSLKLAIVREADGDDADPSNINRRDDLESAAIVMLSPSNSQGARLRGRIDAYRDYVTAMVPDSTKRASIEEALSTAPFRRPGTVTPQPWEEAKFENQPVVASVTLLTKLQNDILYAEGEAISSLLSAVDTTARPVMVIGGKRFEPGMARYEFSPSASGDFKLTGTLEVPLGDGTVASHPFESGYTVIEPTAAVSATMMNVLYAGIDNPIDIAVPGTATDHVSAAMTGGQLMRNGAHWIARPDAKASEAVIKVSVNGALGGSQPVATHTFKVRQLPDPSAYIAVKSADGRAERYRGGRPITKASLLASQGLGAAIDDGVLDIDFKVQSFETVFFDSMGNAMLEKSDGADFSRRQLESFRRLSRGKRFFISRIKATGPDGSERTLSPVEVIVN